MKGIILERYPIQKRIILKIVDSIRIKLRGRNIITTAMANRHCDTWAFRNNGSRWKINCTINSKRHIVWKKEYPTCLQSVEMNLITNNKSGYINGISSIISFKFVRWYLRKAHDYWQDQPGWCVTAVWSAVRVIAHSIIRFWKKRLNPWIAQ